VSDPHTIITRKARIWPVLPDTRVELPALPTGFTSSSLLPLISLGSSTVGMVLYSIFAPRVFGSNGYFTLGLIFMSGTMLLGTLLSFFLQWLPARRRRRNAIRNYQRQLIEIRQLLIALERQERLGCCELDPPFIAPGTGTPGYERLSIEPILQRRYDSQDVALWARRPDDPDFLTVRIGMSAQSPRFTIHRPQSHTPVLLDRALTRLTDEAEGLRKRYASIVAPITVRLDEHSTLALLGTSFRLNYARALARVMLGHLAYHHSPEDVRVIVLAPESQRNVWDWAALLPHTLAFDPRLTGEEVYEAGSSSAHAVAIGNEAILQQLPLISREVSRRELLLGDVQPGLANRIRPMLPRLVIIVDHFTEDDLDPPTQHLPVLASVAAAPVQHHASAQASTLARPRLTASPLLRPELTLALNAVSQLGVTVLAICQSQSTIPPSAGLLIDLISDQDTEKPAWRARLRSLQPDAAAPIFCDWPDEVPYLHLRQFATRLQSLRSLATRRPELRTQVDLCSLFDPPLDPTSYDPQFFWHDPTWRTPAGLPTLRIPIGMKIGDEIQYLDLLKDGPHGLLIGQTGSGKSELLQTIITALSVAYRPDEVNFLLIDYKAGLALEPFSQLPHTIGFLSNVSSPALVQRFITMLQAEATRREIALKEGQTMPSLLIIIDEFAEMVKRTENVLDELFTITRVGREIGMHLLLAAQRPEGIIGSRVRDYVQYRICLRCASPEDSREILRRVDAANLPASIPGRGYLLHGDNQLDLFQAARFFSFNPN
jgi:DNA segregation ATPase FtsK/SpoIIIE-like protein